MEIFCVSGEEDIRQCIINSGKDTLTTITEIERCVNVLPRYRIADVILRYEKREGVETIGNEQGQIIE